MTAATPGPEVRRAHRARDRRGRADRRGLRRGLRPRGRPGRSRRPGGRRRTAATASPSPPISPSRTTSCAPSPRSRRRSARSTCWCRARRCIARVPYLEIDAANIDHVLGINVRAILLGGRVAARSMVDRGLRDGAIVNLTSVSALVADAESVAYEASKGAVDAATRGMARALAPHGIRVNAVGPGSMAKFQEQDPRDPAGAGRLRAAAHPAAAARHRPGDRRRRAVPGLAGGRVRHRHRAARRRR